MSIRKIESSEPDATSRPAVSVAHVVLETDCMEASSRFMRSNFANGWRAAAKLALVHTAKSRASARSGNSG